VGEFGEGCGDPMPGVDIATEFVVSATEVLDECVSGADDIGDCSVWSPRLGRSSSVVGFDGVVGVLLGEMAYGRK
jgi:hypothetical protein